MVSRSRLLVGMAIYAVLAFIAAFTLTGGFRLAVWVFLGGLALKTWVAYAQSKSM